MSETTWGQHRVPCNVTLGTESDGACGSPRHGASESYTGEQVLSDLSAELTRKVLKEDVVTRQEMSKEATVAAISRLLA
jgi:hypothetical protein